MTEDFTEEELDSIAEEVIESLEGEYSYSTELGEKEATVSFSSADDSRPPFLGDKADEILEGLGLESYRVQSRIEDRNYVITIFEDSENY